VSRASTYSSIIEGFFIERTEKMRIRTSGTMTVIFPPAFSVKALTITSRGPLLPLI